MSNTEQVTEDDLNLVASIADATKDEEELWAELEAEEAGTSAADLEDEDLGEGPAVEDHDDEPETVAQGEDDGEGEKEAQAAQEQPDGDVDIWKDAPEHLRKSYSELQTRADQMDHRIRSDTGRVSALQKQINTLRGQLESVTKPQEPDRKSAQDALQGLAQEYPELAGRLEGVLGSMQQQIDNVQSEPKRRQTASDMDFAAHVEVETASLEAAHPGYENLFSDNEEEFASWFRAQAPDIQDAFVRNQKHIVDAGQASGVIRLFKAHLASLDEHQSEPAPADPPGGGTDAKPAETQDKPQSETRQPSSRRQKQLEASASPQGQGRGPTLSGVPEDGNEDDLWDAWDRYDRANGL